MIWERFKWLWTTAWRLKRTAYPRTKWGATLCLAAMSSGLFSIGVLAINFESGYVITSLSLTAKEVSLYSLFLCTFMAIVGAALIYSEWNMKTRHTAKVLISAMPGASCDFPDNVLDPTEKEFCREAVTLGLPQGKVEYIAEQVKRYNAELEADIFRRFILHDRCQRLYIGGLARVPFLVAYGACLRNISSEILYFDKFHREGQWSLLTEEDCKISFEDTAIKTGVNSCGDIGLAIGFTTPISREQIPAELQDFTTILTSNSGHKRNLVKNQVNLQNLSIEVAEILDQMSALPNCRKVHLFLSVQSSLALDIGRRFQEGTQRNWVIHNFDSTTNTYKWALELSKNGLQEISATKG
ncbi:MAG: hypothetical protein B0D91_11905 [Oceanospirillales bacterium LUC14_002_19_P2]|nr:MAG: hypothetical protein B0D91_11905 [Oceanospirillales bacterium LUC14_002_19_P2]